MRARLVWQRRRGARTPRLPRGLHPAAWWIWALGLAFAASTTTNPLLIASIVAVSALVVVARRGDDPWARAYPLYLLLGVVIVAFRVLLHVAVGLKFGGHALFTLPSVRLPSWAAGINVGGTVYLEGLLAAAVEGLRLAGIIACIGAANALANPKRLLRTLPGALHEIGVAVVVSITVAPQLAQSVQRVRRARRLRGDDGRGIRSLARVALPVLQDTLDRSLQLAAAMDSRGYGRIDAVSARARRLTSALMLLGLLGAGLGIYGLLDTRSPAALGAPTLFGGLALACAGLWLGGRRVARSSYRPDPWLAPEWATAACGLIAAAAALASVRLWPEAMGLAVQPLHAPTLPVLAVAGVLVAALPAVLAPDPTRRDEGPTT